MVNGETGESEYSRVVRRGRNDRGEIVYLEQFNDVRKAVWIEQPEEGGKNKGVKKGEAKGWSEATAA